MKHKSIQKWFNNIKERILQVHKYWLILSNQLIAKVNDNEVMFIPNPTNIHDRYDIINYKSDNVLCLINNILRDENYRFMNLNILYYNKNMLTEYQRYCDNYRPERITFIYYNDIVKYSSKYVKSKYVFTDEMYSNYHFKPKGQVIVCLNYYPFPYKSDFIKLIDKRGKSKYLHEQQRINKSYDYLVSLSDLASIAIIQAVPIFFDHCLTLGFPRTEVFYEENSNLRKKLLSLFSFPIKRIIIYVPTHRDYENEDRRVYDKNKAVMRTIWGYENKQTVNKLEELLIDEDSLIIAKIHPIQARTVLAKSNSSRIVSFHEILQRMSISLNELLAVGDVMITDYTSAVFEFLNTNKPIVYYHYDLDKYENTRGFFINPMMPLCAGPIVQNLSELILALKDIMNGHDEYIIKRKFLLDLINTYQDSNASDRIKKYFFKK